MKKIIAVLFLVLMASAVLVAQEEKAQVFAGYQFISLGAGGERVSAPKGWDADVAFKATKNVAIVADIAGNYKEGAKFHTFMFGPRFSASSGKVTPFAEALFGAAHASGFGESATKFGMELGGGLDVNINKSVAFRLAKFDYNFVKVSGANMNNFRYATGIVFKF